MPPVFSGGSGAGGGREKGAPERTAVGLKQGANGENLRIMMFFEGPAFGRVISPRVSGIIDMTIRLRLDPVFPRDSSGRSILFSHQGGVVEISYLVPLLQEG